MGSDNKEQFHGSDLEKIERQYGIKKEEIVSFAANVNPLGIPDSVRTGLASVIDCIQTYPDREYVRLRSAIASYCGTDAGNVIVGNGSSELISGMIRLKKGMKAVILAPAYSEYERNVTLTGGSVSYFRLREEDDFILNTDALVNALTEDYDLLIICNPVNPTSTAVNTDDMRKILGKCRDCHIVVMVDETYMEFVDDTENYEAASLINEYENLYIVRSVSKFFASPGLRLGYALTGNSRITGLLREKRDPWEVSSLAEEAGMIMFSDTAYMTEVKSYISGERERVCEKLHALEDLGLKFYRPKSNFVLCRISGGKTDAAELFDVCIRQKMMIRNCASFKFLDDSYFRFCFMRREDDDRLIDTIERVLKS